MTKFDKFKFYGMGATAIGMIALIIYAALQLVIVPAGEWLCTTYPEIGESICVEWYAIEITGVEPVTPVINYRYEAEVPFAIGADEILVAFFLDGKPDNTFHVFSGISEDWITENIYIKEAYMVSADDFGSPYGGEILHQCAVQHVNSQSDFTSCLGYKMGAFLIEVP